MFFTGPPVKTPLYFQYVKDGATGYGHYSIITFIMSYLRVMGYCDMYLAGYYDNMRHRCMYKCSFFKVRHPIKDQEMGRFNCADCYRTFPLMTYITKHKNAPKKGRALCDIFKEFPDCLALIDTRRRDSTRKWLAFL